MKKILIVEDDPIIGKGYLGHLSRAGYEAEWANNGLKALDLLESFAPDGLLIDFIMPGMNGLELISKIRAKPAFQSVPIIVFSNAILPAFLEQIRARGVVFVLDKSQVSPFEVVQAFRTSGLVTEPTAGSAR